MNDIVRVDHVFDYNDSLGCETLHPLVSVIDFSKCPKARHARRMYGFYCVFLKDVKCGDMRYGRHYYDYQEGTLVFLAPGQVIGYVGHTGRVTGSHLHLETRVNGSRVDSMQFFS